MTKPKLPKSTIGFQPKLSTWVAGGAVLLALIIGVASGGFGGLLMMAGLVGLGTALYSFVTRRKSWAHIASRKSAAIVAAACLLVTLGGSAVYGATHDSSAEPTASVAESASASPSSDADTESDTVTTPTNDPSPLATPEPTPSAEPTVAPPPAPVAAPAPVAVPAPAPAPKAAPAPAVKPAPAPPAGCDPNYSGQCVPIASDVDCAGGSGNGPAYITGTVKVVGTDIYGLDRDHDGIGCE